MPAYDTCIQNTICVCGMARSCFLRLFTGWCHKLRVCGLAFCSLLRCAHTNCSSISAFVCCAALAHLRDQVGERDSFVRTAAPLQLDTVATHEQQRTRMGTCISTPRQCTHTTYGRCSPAPCADCRAARMQRTRDNSNVLVPWSRTSHCFCFCCCAVLNASAHIRWHRSHPCYLTAARITHRP
jgi:hypothetical protein